MKSDLEIQKDVMDEIRWEPLLNASEIGVTVKSGIVTLSGIVNTYSKKLAAECTEAIQTKKLEEVFIEAIDARKRALATRK